MNRDAHVAADTRPEGFKPDGTYEGTGWGIDHDRSHNLVRNPWPVVSSATSSSQRDPFANDVLERLVRSNQDYQRDHGHYIVPLAERLLAARSLAEHLFQMVDPQTWRDTSGDDGQGHYEGDYRAAQVQEEIKSWTQ